MIKTDTEIITVLSDYFKASSPADNWYNTNYTNYTTWDSLRTSFLKNFPTADKAQAMNIENENKLLVLKLEMKDLIMRRKINGVKTHAHIWLMDTVMGLACKLKVTASATYIGFCMGLVTRKGYR